jgi:hypothetical protein
MTARHNTLRKGHQKVYNKVSNGTDNKLYNKVSKKVYTRLHNKVHNKVYNSTNVPPLKGASKGQGLTYQAQRYIIKQINSKHRGRGGVL